MRRASSFLRVGNYACGHRRRYLAYGDRMLAISVEPAGNVLLHHGVEVGAAKTKGAYSGATRGIGWSRPWLQFSVDVKRGVGKIDIRTGMLAMQARGQYLIVQRQGNLQHSRCACRAFQVPKVRLHRAQSN